MLVSIQNTFGFEAGEGALRTFIYWEIGGLGDCELSLTITEDEKFFPLAGCDLCEKWEKIVWNTCWVFPHDS